MTPLWLRLLIVIGIAAGGAVIGAAATTAHYRPIIADMKLTAAKQSQAAAEAVTKVVSANDALKTKLGEQHAQANKALNMLLDHPAGRVLLPATTCASSNQADPAIGSEIPTTGTERTVIEAQEALDRFRSSLEADAVEWSRALNACAVVMEWAKEAPKN